MKRLDCSYTDEAKMTMSEQLAKPPLIEALCEFHFPANVPWDWTTPGLIYARLKDQYPERSQQEIYQMVQTQSIEPPQVEQLLRLQFRKADGTGIVQIAPHTLTINQLKPYPGWTSYRTHIQEILAVYREIASPPSVANFHLRYINRLELPIVRNTDSFDWSEYCTATPGVPMALREGANYSYIQRATITRTDAPMTLNLTAGVAPPETPEHFAFLLDLEQIVHPPKIEFDDIESWLEKAHSGIEDAFQQCFTSHAMAHFRGGEDNV